MYHLGSSIIQNFLGIVHLCNCLTMCVICCVLIFCERRLSSHTFIVIVLWGNKAFISFPEVSLQQHSSRSRGPHHSNHLRHLQSSARNRSHPGGTWPTYHTDDPVIWVCQQTKWCQDILPAHATEGKQDCLDGRNYLPIDTLRVKQNGDHFVDDIFK